MTTVGMQKGKKYEVFVGVGDEVLGSVEHVVLTGNSVQTSVFIETPESLVAVYEALSAAASAVNFHMHKDGLQELVKRRIAELDEAREGEESEPPFPDDVADIPF